MGTVRPTAVAGSFYPADPATLTALVSRLLHDAERRLPPMSFPPKAFLLPHAGYRYSGSTAALGYAALARTVAAGQIRRVVLLGPTHRVAVNGLALPECGAFATPVGQVTVARLDPGLRAAFPQLLDSAPAHALEHSLEVHLPFLVQVLPQAQLVPLAVGRAAAESVADVLDALWGGPETLVVVSSDLSHYHRHEQAQRIDAGTLERVLRLDQPIEHEHACGATPLNGLLLSARRHGLRAQLLGRATSGDTAGDRDRVVGYATVAFG